MRVCEEGVWNGTQPACELGGEHFIDLVYIYILLHEQHLQALVI